VPSQAKSRRIHSGTTPDRFPEREVTRARYTFRSIISTMPAAYLPIARRKYGRFDDRALAADTQLVMEGFQRSGNTFAFFAFEMSQPTPVKVAHHLHAASQIVAGVRRGLPVLLLVREPHGAIVSHLVREPAVTVKQAISHYVRFHRAVLPYRDRLTVGEFTEVTTDFGTVTRRLNERFGTSFGVFAHTEDNVARCFELIEARNRTLFQGRIDERYVARPSASRDALKGRFEEAYWTGAAKPLRERAEALFTELVGA
jgi:hypothetical protein